MFLKITIRRIGERMTIAWGHNPSEEAKYPPLLPKKNPTYYMLRWRKCSQVLAKGLQKKQKDIHLGMCSRLGGGPLSDFT